MRDDLDGQRDAAPGRAPDPVSADEPEPRRRFTIAHELGHWICQCLEGTAKPVYCRAEEIGVDPEAKALEREANIFAANLLMPEAAVRAAGGENRFGVSDEALAWRLYNLRLSDSSPASGANGWR